VMSYTPSSTMMYMPSFSSLWLATSALVNVLDMVADWWMETEWV